MQKGQIYNVNLPEGQGHEQNGRRPAIIYGTEVGGMIVIIPLTTNMDRADFPFTEVIEANSISHLTQQSVALIFQIRSISRNRIVAQIGKIQKAEMERIDGQISGLLSL